MLKYLKIYLYYIKFSLIKMMTYRASFFVHFSVHLLILFSSIVFFQVIYSNVTEIAGWTKWEVLLLIGIHIISYELVLSFFYVGGARILPEKIKDGSIDYDLLKPIHSFFNLNLGKPYLSSLLVGLIGLFIVVYSLRQLNANLEFKNLAAGVIIFVCGATIIFALMTIFTSFSFVFLNASFLPGLAFRLKNFAEKPHQIYQGPVLKGLFFFIFPVVFVASIPAETILHGVNWDYLVMAVCLAAAFLLLAVKVWNRMIKYYTSASS